MRLLLKLRPAEALTVLSLFSLIALTLFFFTRIPHATTVIAAYGLLLLIQLVLIRKERAFKKGPAADMFRSILFPAISLLTVFESLEQIVHTINPRDIDPVLIRLDYLIFRTYPTIIMESIHTPLLTDIFQVAYASYYFIPIVFGVLLKLSRPEPMFDRALFLILLCFYLSYAGYILFPALGPRYAMQHLQSFDIQGALVGDQIQALLNRIEGIKRDAFPSGHTAVVLVVSGLAYRFHRGYFYATLPLIMLLVFSTVYCRYHYAVDVIGGVVLAVITFYIGEKYYGYWQTRNSLNY